VAEIYRDNEGVVLKKLGKPVRRTIVDKNTRVSDDFDLTTPEEESTRPVGKRTLIANEGPSSDGKIDFKVNPDCFDYLLQYHESYKHPNDAEGYKATSEKVCNSFNKIFKSQMTPPELASELNSRLGVSVGGTTPPTVLGAEAIKNRQVGQRLKPQEEPRQEQQKSESSDDILFTPLKVERLSTVSGGKVLLSGERYEICKILNCPHICVVSRNKGKLTQNGLMHAACSNSEQGEIDKKTCPQEAPRNDKEELAYQLFFQTFGDEMKARKMLFISKEVFSPK